jgi:TPR repeat protein
MNFLDKLFGIRPAANARSFRMQYLDALEREDWNALVPLLRQAIAQDNDAFAMGLMGTLYAFGNGVEIDPHEACLWFRQGAVGGDMLAQSALGLCLLRGAGIRQDTDEGVFWLVKAARTGNEEAIDTLHSLAFTHGKVVSQYISETEVGELYFNWLQGKQRHDS